MKKKQLRRKIDTEMNRKRFRIIFIILIVAAIFIFVGGTFIGLRDLFIPDLHYVLLFEMLGTVGLYSGCLILCAFFLYICFVITIKNPQKLKRPKVFTFATIGVIVLIFSLWFVRFSSQELMAESKALKDYKEGNWMVKELYVKDVYGPDLHSNLTILETEEGDFLLYWKHFQIPRGKTYRITYLESTQTIVEIVALE